jgi:hypothetical protein
VTADLVMGERAGDVGGASAEAAAAAQTTPSPGLCQTKTNVFASSKIT